MSSLIADRRLYLSSDKQHVVEDGDESAAFLLCTPGDEIPEAVAKDLGLVVKDDKLIQSKAQPKSEDKARAKTEDKGTGKPAEKRATKA